ncbi:MAG: hypothetical protein R6X02_20675 [Enhygromyxa sp.]
MSQQSLKDTWSELAERLRAEHGDALREVETDFYGDAQQATLQRLRELAEGRVGAELVDLLEQTNGMDIEVCAKKSAPDENPGNVAILLFGVVNILDQLERNPPDSPVKVVFREDGTSWAYCPVQGRAPVLCPLFRGERAKEPGSGSDRSLAEVLEAERIRFEEDAKELLTPPGPAAIDMSPWKDLVSRLESTYGEPVRVEASIGKKAPAAPLRRLRKLAAGRLGPELLETLKGTDGLTIRVWATPHHAVEIKILSVEELEEIASSPDEAAIEFLVLGSDTGWAYRPADGGDPVLCPTEQGLPQNDRSGDNRLADVLQAELTWFEQAVKELLEEHGVRPRS